MPSANYSFCFFQRRLLRDGFFSSETLPIHSRPLFFYVGTTVRVGSNGTTGIQDARTDGLSAVRWFPGRDADFQQLGPLDMKTAGRRLFQQATTGNRDFASGDCLCGIVVMDEEVQQNSVLLNAPHNADSWSDRNRPARIESPVHWNETVVMTRTEYGVRDPGQVRRGGNLPFLAPLPAAWYRKRKFVRCAV